MSSYELSFRRLTLHEIALLAAERANPGGEHLVTEVEFDGKPDPENPEAPYIEANVKVVSRVPAAAQMVDIQLDVVPLDPGERESTHE